MKKGLSPFILYSIAVSGILGIGFLLGWVLKDNLGQPDTRGENGAIVVEPTTLTNPLLACETHVTAQRNEFYSLKKTLTEYIEKSVQEGSMTHMSVYFRDFLSGAWTGIEEKETFSPASLLKVPMAMAIFSLAQNDPTILQKELIYTQIYDPIQPYYKPEKRLELGMNYTVEGLVYRMIVYSDNEAMDMLRENYDTALFDGVYEDIGMEVPNDENPENFMTVKAYASFFRILYNASYLNKEYSEKLLDLLTKITFANGIRAGVPENIVVAHKFGERLFTDEDIAQLHDCGIVYHPKTPYLLCIMTRGKNYDILTEKIRQVSKLTWDDINGYYDKSVQE